MATRRRPPEPDTPPATSTGPSKYTLVERLLSADPNDWSDASRALAGDVLLRSHVPVEQWHPAQQRIADRMIAAWGEDRFAAWIEAGGR